VGQFIEDVRFFSATAVYEIILSFCFLKVDENYALKHVMSRNDVDLAVYCVP